MARTSAAHSSKSSRVVAKKRPLGTAPRQWPERPTRCSATAIARGELIWHDQIDGADIDSEFERSGRHQHSYLAFFQLALGRQPQLARQAAVMRGHLFFAHALAQLMGHALGHAARVDEDQRRAVLLDQLDEAVVNLVPHFVGGDRAERHGRNFDCRDRACACGRC